MTIIKKHICAIPARAASKRLVNKNLLALASKPMIAYSIETAIKSGIFESVYVCTEDQCIAEVAKSYGAKVPFLMQPELCDDLVASHIPCQEMASFLINQGEEIEVLVCLQPTSPLRSIDDIKNSVAIFREDDLNFLVSVTPIDPHYFHWALQCKNQNNWEMFFGNQYLKERPLLPPVYRPNGSIKIAKLAQLKKTNHFFGDKMGIIETPEERSIHVATQFDFDLCEFLLGKQ
ncbi:MAG: acylneuraminate cytidylyltransferase family protein [Cyanobacteria bacterium]|nr:acylneuraminate cytidylyltransferase family protein [Cyanobacteriota bacterium]